ncbi:MAG: hypothetical protein HC786_32930 [Richelia sp. CSU_2_1]|nr:hypothetical protein [Richelia sp. CSU_2_1]
MGELLTVNCQLSTVNCQLSTVNCQLSTFDKFLSFKILHPSQLRDKKL